MTNDQKKQIAERWLQSLCDAYRLKYIEMLTAIAANGGDVVESAYHFMNTHNQTVLNNMLSKMDVSQITRSMFPKGVKGWFKWILACNSANLRNKRNSVGYQDRMYFRNLEKANMSALEKNVNNVRFWDQRPNATAGFVSGDYIRQ